MSKYRYEVDIDNTIRAWDDGNPYENGEPFLLQPNWPDGTPWANKEEATTWAETLIKMLEDPKNGRPGDTPSNPFIPWTPEEQPTEE